MSNMSRKIAKNKVEEGDFFWKDGKKYVAFENNTTGKLDSCRVDKLVYTSFMDCNDLPSDDSKWDLIHIDGNEDNCALDNLMPVIL